MTAAHSIVKVGGIRALVCGFLHWHVHVFRNKNIPSALLDSTDKFCLNLELTVPVMQKICTELSALGTSAFDICLTPARYANSAVDDLLRVVFRGKLGQCGRSD